MAVTYANGEIVSRGKFILYYTEITLDSSYASGGESIAASDFGFAFIKGIWPASAEGYTVEAVRSSDTAWLMKVYAFSNSTNTVLGNIVTGKDLSDITIPCLVLGR